MRSNYDFSKAEKGKFYKPNAVMKVPVYLNAENQAFVTKLATKKKKDVSDIVNHLIKGDRELAKAF